ncbi:hypothetical protein BD413DRAFT_164887 [Trametes elegans]|nr:hypothetical protein BD413DRAFT_164887 [Trametes elegans]
MVATHQRTHKAISSDLAPCLLRGTKNQRTSSSPLVPHDGKWIIPRWTKPVGACAQRARARDSGPARALGLLAAPVPSAQRPLEKTMWVVPLLRRAEPVRATRGVVRLPASVHCPTVERPERRPLVAGDACAPLDGPRTRVASRSTTDFQTGVR